MNERITGDDGREPLEYRGLRFAVYRGVLNRAELQSKKTFYVWYDGKHMLGNAIRHRVDAMMDGNRVR